MLLLLLKTSYKIIMSNPGVLYLTRKKICNGNELRIEDNIGEAIHIHYGEEWRIDLTVSQFLELESKSEEWINSILGETGFNIKYFDPAFVEMISDYLMDLETIQFDTVKLNDLLVLTRNMLGVPVIRSLNQSKIIKALNGDKKELMQYQQDNYRDQDNWSRVESMQKAIAKKGYPFDDKYIVVFNNQNVIRDGQHRAACLLAEKGNVEIPIIRMNFKNENYNTPMHPWIEWLFKWDIKRLKRLAKLMLKKLYSIARSIYRKIR